MRSHEKEVRYDLYCKQCKHEKLADYQNPCNECMTKFFRTDTDKPIHFEKKRGGEH